MSDKKEPEVKFEELSKEMEAWFTAFEKKLKAMKIEPKVAKQAAINLRLDHRKMLLAPMKKSFGNGPIPLPKLKPAGKKTKKPSWLHIKAAPAMPPSLANGVKFMVGTKNIQAGMKMKWDPVKQKLKMEPTAGLVFKFKGP